MNIKKVIRNTSILFAPFILIILIIISFLILKKDFQNSHLPLYIVVQKKIYTKKKLELSMILLSMVS